MIGATVWVIHPVDAFVEGIDGNSRDAHRVAMIRLVLVRAVFGLFISGLGWVVIQAGPPWLQGAQNELSSPLIYLTLGFLGGWLGRDVLALVKRYLLSKS